MLFQSSKACHFHGHDLLISALKGLGVLTGSCDVALVFVGSFTKVP